MSKNILITGADGNIGKKLIKRLLNATNYNIYALVINAENAKNTFEAENIMIYNRVIIIENKDFLEKDYDIEGFDALHLAFSRRNMPNEAIADSIDFAQKIFAKLKERNVGRVIYMSSQGVYGNCKNLRSEATLPAPNSAYTMAKYAVEKLFNVYFSDKKGKATCIRLDSVVQSQNLVLALCKQAKSEGIIHLKGGKQCFSYIDIEDAVSALVSLTLFKGNWNAVYNVGLNNGRITLVELAENVAAYCEKVTGKKVRIELEEQSIELWAGMDTTLFMNDTGWSPEFDIADMIEHIYQTI